MAFLSCFDVGITCTVGYLRILLQDNLETDVLYSVLSLNKLFDHRRKFKGITSKPNFCQAIYQAFENHQAMSGEDLTDTEKSQG